MLSEFILFLFLFDEMCFAFLGSLIWLFFSLKITGAFPWLFVSNFYQLGCQVDPVVYNMLHEDPGNISYSAVGGLSDQIRELRESIELPLMNPELFLRVGIKPPKVINFSLHFLVSGLYPCECMFLAMQWSKSLLFWWKCILNVETFSVFTFIYNNSTFSVLFLISKFCIGICIICRKIFESNQHWK
jgi:hypothetical protein